GDYAGVRARAVGHDELIIARVAAKQFRDGQVVRVRTDDAPAVGEVDPVAPPLVGDRLRSGDHSVERERSSSELGHRDGVDVQGELRRTGDVRESAGRNAKATKFCDGDEARSSRDRISGHAANGPAETSSLR